jgi:hypothetical protein
MSPAQTPPSGKACPPSSIFFSSVMVAAFTYVWIAGKLNVISFRLARRRVFYGNSSR